MPEEFGLSQRPTHDDRSSSSRIDIDIKTPTTSRGAQVPAETEPRCQVQEVAEDDRNRLVVSVDVERRHSGYQTPGCEGRINPVMTSEEEEEEEEEEEDDDEDTDSEASTSTDADEEQEPPDDRLKANGWLSSVPRAAAVALPSDEPPSFQKININSSTVGRIGPTNVYKGPVTIVVSSVVGAADDRGEDRIEPKAIKDKDGSTTPTENWPTDACTYTNGLSNGQKLSTKSAHPLFPNRRARVADWCRMRRWTVMICGAVLILLLVIIFSFTLGKGRPPQDNQPSVPAVPNDTSINNDPTIPGVRIVPRVEWGAQPPTVAPTNLQVDPPVYVVISHTATTFCYTQAQCVLNVRVAQTLHIESKGWNDIGYNFLVGGDGLVYEGRGWGIEGAHSFNYNYKSIGLSFIGTFNNEQPTKAQVHAAKKLIEWGVENGKISNDYKLLGHRQIAKTESPGEALYKIIKTWDHWSPTP